MSVVLYVAHCNYCGGRGKMSTFHDDLLIKVACPKCKGLKATKAEYRREDDTKTKAVRVCKMRRIINSIRNAIGL